MIAEFLEQAHPDPSLLPDDPMERAHCRLITRIADLYIMEAMVPLFANLSRATRNQEHVNRALSVLDRGLGYLEPWINPAVHAVDGRLTLADLAVAPILRYAAEYPPIIRDDVSFRRASQMLQGIMIAAGNIRLSTTV